MTTLPTLQSSTVAAINDARVAEHEHWDSIGMSMSELGSECDRALWYSFRWASKPETIDGQKLRRFETGHIEEKRLLDDLRRIPGVTVCDTDPDTGKQFKVYSHGGHVRGKLDGLVDGLPEAPTKIHVVECKSHNAKSFKELIKKGLKDSKPAHWFQCQKYMQLRGHDRCLYIAVNKDTDELYAERVRYDAVEITKLDVRLESIISQTRAPSRIAESADKYPCIFCRHREVCHRGDFGRNHCRTCLHSTPIVDHESTDATWLCERHGRTLTVDEQRAGCPSHLYLPACVPGEQRDAGDDWVSYDMAHGAVWIDRETKQESKQ